MMDSDTEATGRAARCGFLSYMRYAYRRGAPWHTHTTSFAARGGHLECLRFAYENGATWAEDTTGLAARAGSLPCLAYAHEHGAPWDETTTFECTLSMSPECLTYATNNGAPRHPETVQVTIQRLGTFPRSEPCLECLCFVLDRQFPYDPRRVMALGNRARDTVLSALGLIRGVRLIQRAWRDRRDRIRENRRAAVKVIEDAYMVWACRPGDGVMFLRTMDAFLSSTSEFSLARESVDNDSSDHRQASHSPHEILYQHRDRPARERHLIREVEASVHGD